MFCIKMLYKVGQIAETTNFSTKVMNLTLFVGVNVVDLLKKTTKCQLLY